MNSLWVLFGVLVLTAVTLQKQKRFDTVKVLQDSVQAKCTTANLNIRAGPCTNIKILTTIPKGRQVNVQLQQTRINCGYTWAAATYENFSGWVATSYLASCGGGSPESGTGSINLSSFPTSYSASKFTFTGRKAQLLHFLKSRFGASGTTYNGHSNGALGSSDLWCPGATYAKDNRNVACMNNMADFIAANLGPLGLEYVIWKQRIFTTGLKYWRGMENRGSITQNHFDHVHITFA